MRTILAPQALISSKIRLFQWPPFSSLSGSETATPRNTTGFPEASTNWLPCTRRARPGFVGFRARREDGSPDDAENGERDAEGGSHGRTPGAGIV